MRDVGAEVILDVFQRATGGSRVAYAGSCGNQF